jgi:hypothetical protein
MPSADASTGHDVTDAPDRSIRRAAEHVFFGVGGGIASTVYGTVVVMATLTAAYASKPGHWKLAAVVATTAFVLWIAHLYSHGLSESIVLNRRLTREELGEIVRRELGILSAALAPVIALVLGALGVFREATAVWLALGVGLLTLAVEGIRFARFERLGLLGTAVVMGLNLALGLLVVALKVGVAH